MDIKFNCPNPECRKPFRARSEQAGKKARCPKCKQVLTIPAAGPAYHPEMEALAAAALADPVATPAPAAPAKPIYFDCPNCDERIQAPAEQAGQRIPCPHCTRIVKVPMPVKEAARDWRKADKLAAAAVLKGAQPAPEGAWGNITSSTTASRRALEEAEAIPILEERISPTRWVARGLVATAGVLLLGLGAWWGMHFRSQSQQTEAIGLALASLPGKDSPVPPAGAAEIYRGLGEYYVRAGQIKKEAKEQFDQARNRAQQATTPQAASERDAVLIDLALDQIDLGGDKDDVDHHRRISWNDVAKELGRTLKHVQSPEARQEAVREVARKLVAGGQPRLTENLVSQARTDVERPEILGIVGLELARGGYKPAAEALAGQALKLYDVPTAKGAKQVTPPPVAPSLVALLIALDQEPKAEKLQKPPEPSKEPFPEARLGYAQGWAMQGKWADAVQLAGAPGPADQRVQALLAVATLAGDANSAEAARALAPAIALLTQNQVAGKSMSSWVLLRLVSLAAQVGQAKQAEPIVDQILDDSLRGRARREILKANPGAVTLEMLAEEAKKQPAHPALLEFLARQCTHVNRSATLRAIGDWPKALQPFGYIGAALGEQDGER